MLVLLGFGEVAFLVASTHGYQNGADVLAQWAASEMTKPGESWQAGWGQVVREESDRTRCGDLNPVVTFPDGTHTAGDRVLVRWSCRYHPRLTTLWDGSLPVGVQSEAVVPGVIPAPSPS